MEVQKSHYGVFKNSVFISVLRTEKLMFIRKCSLEYGFIRAQGTLKIIIYSLLNLLPL